MRPCTRLLRSKFVCFLFSNLYTSLLTHTHTQKSLLLTHTHSSNLNKTVPFEGYEEVLKPHLNQELLAQREPLGDLWIDEDECIEGEPLNKAKL